MKSKSSTPDLDTQLFNKLNRAKPNNLQPPVIQEQSPKGEIAPKEPEKPIDMEVQLNTKITPALKKDLKMYCVMKGIDQKEFLNTIIAAAIYSK